MNLPLSNIIAIIATLSTLQACAVSTPRPVATVQNIESVSVQEAPELDTLIEGDSVMFHEGILAGYGQVVVGRVYTAASGRLCKKIRSASGSGPVSVVCRVSKDRWYVRTLPIIGESNGFISVDTRENSDSSSLLLPTTLK